MVIVCVDFVLFLGMVRDQAGDLNVQGQKSDPRMVEAGDLLYHMFAAEPMMDESTLTQAEKDELNSYKFVVSDHLQGVHAVGTDIQYAVENGFLQNNLV